MAANQPFTHIIPESKTHAPNDNTAAVITLAAATGETHVVDQVAWSYDDDPTGGNLKIEDDTTTIFTVDITSKGPGFIPFEGGIQGTTGNKVVITLAAGGAGIAGKVNARVR